MLERPACLVCRLCLQRREVGLSRKLSALKSVYMGMMRSENGYGQTWTFKICDWEISWEECLGSVMFVDIRTLGI